MEVFEAIKARRSVRAFTDAPVSKEQLTRFLEAIRLAPTWKDKQCCNVIVLSDRAQIRKLGELLRGNPGPAVFDTVPYFIVVTADPALSGVRDDKPYYMTDAGIALENGVLAATEMGLGTCWIGAFTEGPIKEFLGIPENIRIVAFTPLGHPAEAPDARPRKALDELAFDGAWGKPLA
ncbi:MAG: nitroreductase family protein [Oscillospiraceae bacterium]